MLIPVRLLGRPILLSGCLLLIGGCIGPLKDKPELLKFALRHPIIAGRIGAPEPAGHNISSQAESIAAALGLSNSAEMDGRGTQTNAVRHTLWQAAITARYGSAIAQRVGNANETAPHRYDNISTDHRHPTLVEADTYCDLHNNRIGRSLGAQNPNERNLNILAARVLDYYRQYGLWEITGGNERDGWSVGIVRLPESDYRRALHALSHTNASAPAPAKVGQAR